MSAKCEVCGVVADIDTDELATGRVEFRCVGCDTPHWATRHASGRLPRAAAARRGRASRPPIDDAPVPDSTRLDDLRALAQRSSVSASSLPPPRFGAPPALLALGPANATAPAHDLEEAAPPSVREAIRISAPPLSDPAAETFARDVEASSAPSSRRLGGRSSRAGIAAVACAALLFGTGSALSARLGPDRGVASAGAGASVSAAAHSATYGAFDVDVVTGAARKVAEPASSDLARASATTASGSGSGLVARDAARPAPAGAGRAVGAAAESPAGQATAAAPEAAALNKQAAPAKKQRVEKQQAPATKTLAEAMAEATRTKKK